MNKYDDLNSCRFVSSFLPAPTQLSQDQLEAEERLRAQKSYSTALASSRREPPPYGHRKGWVPRTLEVNASSYMHNPDYNTFKAVFPLICWVIVEGVIPPMSHVYCIKSCCFSFAVNLFPAGLWRWRRFPRDPCGPVSSGDGSKEEDVQCPGCAGGRRRKDQI